MDRERLAELLQDPSQVAGQDLPALRTLADRFPWFSGARLLLAAGEHGTGDVLATDRHGTPTAFLPSRAVLFDLVNPGKRQRGAPMRMVKDEPPLPMAGPPNGPVQERGPVVAPREPREAAMPEEKAKEALPEVPLIALPDEGTPAAWPEMQAVAPAPEAPPAARPGPAPTDPAAQLLDRQIREAIQATGFDLGRYEAPPPAAAPAPQEEAPPKAPPLPPVHDALLAMTAPRPPAPAEDSPAPRPIPPGTRLRFTDWLERSETGIAHEPPEIQDKAEMESPPAEAPIPTSPEMAALPPGLSPQELMEQFIQRSSPLPAAAKAEFFNPQQAAKRSLQDDGLVSETLARIHEKQGNFAKAMEVYERLAVKYPEKSVYFAALSKALEGRMHK